LGRKEIQRSKLVSQPWVGRNTAVGEAPKKWSLDVGRRRGLTGNFQEGRMTTFGQLGSLGKSRKVKGKKLAEQQEGTF